MCIYIYTNASFLTASIFGVHYCSQASRQSVALSQLFLSLMGPHHLNSSFPLVIHLYSFLSFFPHHFISLLIFNSFFFPFYFTSLYLFSLHFFSSFFWLFISLFLPPYLFLFYFFFSILLCLTSYIFSPGCTSSLSTLMCKHIVVCTVGCVF